MADAEFQFDSKAWETFLNKLSKKVKDPIGDKTFTGIVSSVFYQDYQEHFEKEQGPDGKWAAWSKSYQEHLSKIGRSNNNILRFTGRMFQTLTPSSWKESNGSMLFYNPAKTSSGFPYAKAHDEGGPRLPKRSFMWLSNKAMSNIASQVGKWLEQT